MKLFFWVSGSASLLGATVSLCRAIQQYMRNQRTPELTEILATIQKEKMRFQEMLLFVLHHYWASGVVMAKVRAFDFPAYRNSAVL